MAFSFFKKSSLEQMPETPREKNMWKNILLALEDALFVYDTDFRVVFWNRAAEHLFALREEDVVGHTVSPKDVGDASWQLLGQVVFPSLAPQIISRSEPGALPQIVDLTFTDPFRELRTITAPVPDDKGGQFGFLKIVRDRTEEALNMKSKNDFLELASHQLRGPVTDVNWALETLLENNAVSEENKPLVAGALEAGKALLQIANDFLSVSQAEGSANYHFEETDIPQFVENVMSSLLSLAKHAEVNFYLNPVLEPPPKILIDKERLGMALINIFDNAIRYNVKNGEVVVSIAKGDSGSLVIKVKDTGIGIPKEEIERISNKFYRAENARRYQANGSGLGLYIAKNILQAHGGRLHIASELNRGTEMTLTLPTDSRFIPSYKPADA